MEMIEIIRIMAFIFAMYIVYITFNKNRELREELKKDNLDEKYLKHLKLGLKLNMLMATIGLYYILMIVSFWLGIYR